MKKQSATGLFFSMFLRAVVVIIGIVIIVIGIVTLMKFIKLESGNNDGPATTVGESILTESESRDDLLANPEPSTSYNPGGEGGNENATPIYNRNILVLNSTSIQGLAGRWCSRLNDAGYVNTFASDYQTEQTTTRIVAREAGAGQELVSYFNGASYEVGEVTEGTSEDTSKYDIVIILGTQDSDQ